jgi:hypothetical protein
MTIRMVIYEQYLLLCLLVLLDMWLERTRGTAPHATRPQIPVHEGEELFFQKVKESLLHGNVRSNVLEREGPRFASKCFHELASVPEFGQNGLSLAITNGQEAYP